MRVDRGAELKSGCRIGIDGCALDLKRGTGVATYARNLSFALRDLGADVDVLYGRQVQHGGAQDFSEVEFFDSVLDPPAAWSRRAQMIADGARSLITLIHATARATEVPVRGIVELSPLAGRLPAPSRSLNAPAVFSRARWHFRLTGQFLRVEVPDPPDIFHWTHPMPLYLAGSRNVYSILDLIPLRLPYTTLTNGFYVL